MIVRVDFPNWEMENPLPKLKSTDLFAELSGAPCSQAPLSPGLQQWAPQETSPRTAFLHIRSGAWSVHGWNGHIQSSPWHGLMFHLVPKSIILSFYLHSSSICAWLKNLSNVKKDHWKETNIAQNKIHFTIIHWHFFLLLHYDWNLGHSTIQLILCNVKFLWIAACSTFPPWIHFTCKVIHVSENEALKCHIMYISHLLLYSFILKLIFAVIFFNVPH